MRVITQKMARVTTLCGVTLVGVGSQAIAGPSREDIVRPNLDRITLCQEAIQEVARQGGLLHDEYSTWKAWRESLSEELARGAARLDEQQAFEKALADTYVAAAPSLVPLEGESAHIPRFGWGVFGIVEQHRDEVNEAIAEVDATVSQGEYSFDVKALGWSTGDQLETAIQGDVDRIEELELSLSDGTFSIHYPGLGWVNRTQLESCITDEQQKIDDVFAQISAGEYAMNLPNLGWITRNQLEAKIEQAEADLEAVRAQKAEGEMSINRAGVGWFTQNQLNSWVTSKTNELGEVQASLGDGTFVHNFPTGGWLTANDLNAAIDTARAGIAEVEASAANGEYSVPMKGGWTNRNEATAALALPDCVKDGPTPCLNPSSRPHYEDALRRIPIEVQTDIALRQLDIDKLESWLGAIASHATPQIDNFKITLDIYGVRQAEFDIELANDEARLQRNIDWLRDNLEFLP